MEKKDVCKMTEDKWFSLQHRQKIEWNWKSTLWLSKW